MKSNLILLIFTTIGLLLASYPLSTRGGNPSIPFNPEKKDSVIWVDNKELVRLNLNLPDGGLQPQPGVLNLQLFRSTRDNPEIADGDGWTYAHHMDLAIWKGKYYAAWNMTLKDEDRLPSKVVYATSPDGITWSNPVDLFPRESAWATRFYFFRASNDRMLTFCVAKNNAGEISEDKKSILQVREIKSNHQLGPVYILVNPSKSTAPSFETSKDKGFVTACREAVSNNMLLEQQDYGVFLGDRKMVWHEKTPPYKGFYKFGKAFCFYHREDGKIVGLTKMGFATTSDDNGKSWSEPILPISLTAGSAKVWGQKTNDDRYVLAYNPDPNRSKRYPLVLVQGDDGSHFKDMRVVHGEFSPLRYPGLYKDPGYQYVRGIPEWSTDHSLNDKALWLIYSVNKEDIWLSRIPLPVRSSLPGYPNDDFKSTSTGKIVESWNLYSPKWAPVSIITEPGIPTNKCLALEDGDPVEHAQAMRLFPTTPVIEAKFRIRPMQYGAYFEAEMADVNGNPMFQVYLNDEVEIMFSGKGNPHHLDFYQPGKWMTILIKADSRTGFCTIALNGTMVKSYLMKPNGYQPFQRLIFRTGKRYDVGATVTLATGADRKSDKPDTFLIDDVVVGPILE